MPYPSIAKKLVSSFIVLGSVALSTGLLQAAPWLALGPYGGDARTIAADPKDSNHLFLGTATGYMYESHDAGTNWKRLSRVGKRDDLVLDHILVDPANAKHLIVGAWLVDRPDGGLFESKDGGNVWNVIPDMKGQSVRSMAVAPSNPKMIVVGTLQGVYRTMDGGTHWSLISPGGSSELHEVESVAIDPHNPMVIYAGTWHLPWKTVDGGVNWTNLGEKEGVHDDSDIFSIILDPKDPQLVYLSACSGIYKSVNSGSRFERVRKEQLGMDHAALRTRKLMQDPSNPQIVFAGTTEGLWRTTDGAATFRRVTAGDVIVNDIYIDPKNTKRVMLSTDRSGVLVSEDGGTTFAPSNTGFSARQVTSFAGDPQHPATVYAGIVNDKAAGGVFMSLDGGVQWHQESVGLNGRDVFSLAVTPDGTVLAGTGHGVFRLSSGAWVPSGSLATASTVVAKPTAVAKPVPRAANGAKRPSMAPLVPAKTAPTTLDAAIYALVSTPDATYAGTSQGLMRGDVDGRNWSPVTALQMPETRYVAAQKQVVVVAGLRRMSVSVDGGKTFDTVTLPEAITQVSAATVDSMGNLWVGGREGLYYSTDYGLTWKTLRNLYVTQVTGIYFDPLGNQVLVTSAGTTLTFAAHLPDYKVTYVDTGWDLRFVRPVGNHMIGATNFDGVVVQPVMVDSASR